MADHDAPTVVSANESVTIGAHLPVDEDAQSIPSTIGRYRIIRLLGQGGMGAVYEAEQEAPHRTVALKVIRAGYADGEMMRRFENETQALGRLQHPGIAQIYDAGTAQTAFGRQPYFAMELVRGETLLEYCDDHKLSVRQRLELIAKICDAVQHAHQRGLIHRDLKPANILVGEDGQPKVLDFGVARLTDSDTQATRQTDLGQIIGTLAYMSPEQVLGDPEEIDTRSDVYALGVVLYELLAERMPYMLSNLLHEAFETIRLAEPQKLSAVNRSYRGDIETIVGKALEKDKTRRYASAAELAADIRRYLHDEPIVARPPSPMYQLQKFARRNKALVAGVAAVFVVLLLGVVASTWEAVQARRAQKKAEQETAVAAAVNDFLQNDLLGQASAYNQTKPDPNITVRTVLDRAAANIQGKFKGQPAVEAAIRETIGNTYADMGLYSHQKAELDRAYDLSRHTLGPDDPRTLSILLGLGKAEAEFNRYAQAETLVREVVDRSLRVLGPENPTTLEAMHALARIYFWEEKFSQAESLGLQASTLARKAGVAESKIGLLLKRDLAAVYREEEKYAQAEPLLQEVVEVEQRTLGPENPGTLNSMDDLAFLYLREGKYSQAEALLRQSVAGLQRGLGPEHPQTLNTMDDLASAYFYEGQYTNAEALYRQVLATEQRVVGPQDPDTLVTMRDLALTYKKEQKRAQAEALDRRALEGDIKLFGLQNPETLRTMNDLLGVYEADGRYAEAEDVNRRERAIAPDNALVLNQAAWLFLTANKQSLRQPKEALNLVRQAVKAAPDNVGYLNTLGLAEVRNGLWDEAISTLDKCVKANNGKDASDFLFLAMAYQGRGDHADADKNYERGAELARVPAAANPELRMLWTEAASALGKPAPKVQAAKATAS